MTITAVKERAPVTHYVAIFSDITSRKTAENEIQSLAFFDPLTRLPNRRLLMDRLKQALVASCRHQRHALPKWVLRLAERCRWRSLKSW